MIFAGAAGIQSCIRQIQNRKRKKMNQNRRNVLPMIIMRQSGTSFIKCGNASKICSRK